LKEIDHHTRNHRLKSVALPQLSRHKRERARFARVLEDAADLLEQHGELPDAVRWLRKEAQAWRR
jgi:hypothetical protein